MATNIAPVITSKKKKKTLSALKKSALKNEKVSKVRTVLAWPHKQSYWPALDEECDLALQVLLERLLSPARLPTNSLPQSMLLEAHKSKCDDLKKATYAKPTDECKQLRSSLLLGVNAVSRALEKDETSMVLLAGDINPPILGSHIISMCSKKHVPALVMPSLRKCAKKSLGFNCIALGLKSSVSGNHFTSLEERVVELSERFIKNECPQFQRVKLESTNDENVKVDVSQDIELDPSLDIYKYRTSNKERVFVPEDPTMIHMKPGKRSGQDCISFDECQPVTSREGDVTATRKRKISHYQPLIVKNIQSNPDKVKKKKKVKN